MGQVITPCTRPKRHLTRQDDLAISTVKCHPEPAANLHQLHTINSEVGDKSKLAEFIWANHCGEFICIIGEKRRLQSGTAVVRVDRLQKHSAPLLIHDQNGTPELSLPQRRPHRRQCLLRLAPLRPARLSHLRPAAAAFAAHRQRRLPHQIHRVHPAQ